MGIWELLEKDLERHELQISFGSSIWELFGKDLRTVKPPNTTLNENPILLDGATTHVSGDMAF